MHLIPLTTNSNDKKNLFLYYSCKQTWMCVPVKWQILRTWMSIKKIERCPHRSFGQKPVKRSHLSSGYFSAVSFFIKAKYSCCIIKTFKVVNLCWIQIKICWLLLRQGVYIYDTIYQINILCQINAKEVLVVTLVLKIFY